MNIIGIDPGNSGALVVLDENLTPVEWMRMPTYSVGSSNRVNAAAVSAFIKNSNISHAYVENVHSMPAQGVSSVFTFGHALGVIMGVLGAFEIPVTMVTPQSWKKRANLINLGKDAARSKALQIYPNWRSLDKKIEGQAMADAALIARYGK